MVLDDAPGREDARDALFSGNDPFAIAERWLAEAWESEPNDANAIALASAGADGMPNVRMVLLKEIEANGFVFYTNYESAKGGELTANPQAAFVMHWKSLRRQVRARGAVERVDGEQADAYFDSRHPQSRAGAIASRQSRVLEGRETLEKATEAVRASSGDTMQRPDHWGGFRIVPVEIEFWADGDHRLHDRFRWTREGGDADGWTVRRLYP